MAYPSLPPCSIEYWFRCMDLDGDGVLSLFEMVYFYEEVLQRLQEMNIDCLSVENTVCQILDMVNPKERGERAINKYQYSIPVVQSVTLLVPF